MKLYELLRFFFTEEADILVIPPETPNRTYRISGQGGIIPHQTFNRLVSRFDVSVKNGAPFLVVHLEEVKHSG